LRSATNCAPTLTQAVSKNIMRTTITLICIMISLASFSQDLKYFDSKNKLDWSQFESVEVTIDLLESNFDFLKNNPYPELEYIIKNLDKFHLLDIDNDQVNELIYNGWNGGEGEMIVIYKLKDGYYKEHQRFFGRIKDIRKTEINLIRFIVYDYACCAGYVDNMETFDFNPISKQFDIVGSIAKIDETSLPSDWIEPIRFEIKNTPYNLRYSPEIITGLKNGEYDFSPINGQNITASYKAGDKGIAYAESTDSTGRVWWFVIMDSKPDSGESLYYDGNNKFDDYKPIGWISSRYVDIVD
jgi:hypothetical protein